VSEVLMSANTGKRRFGDSNARKPLKKARLTAGMIFYCFVISLPATYRSVLPMDETLFNNLTLAEKANFVQEKGQFIEAQDFYSFFILIYMLNQQQIKLLYDFTGLLLSVEEDQGKEYTEHENYLSSQLEDSLDIDN
jgi:hypothetical protein